MNSSFRTLNLKLRKKKRFIEWGKIEYVPVTERMVNEWRYWEALWRSWTKGLKETEASDVVLKLETQSKAAMQTFFHLSLTKTVHDCFFFFFFLGVNGFRILCSITKKSLLIRLIETHYVNKALIILLSYIFLCNLI